MPIVITEPALLTQLAQTFAAVEFRDGNGNFLGTFAPPNGKLPLGVSSPFTEAELEQRRKQRDGRPLADILRDLEKRG